MMFNLIKLTAASLKNRKLSVSLTVISIAISIILLFGVQTIREAAKTSFISSVSGIDLIIGAPSGEVPLLLSTVFRIGNASNNISWHAFEKIEQNEQVKWAIPISLGDSHKGYKVLATNDVYFQQYKFGNGQTLSLADGQFFNDEHDVVLGSEVAKKLDYALDQDITIAHGTKHTRFSEHKDGQFHVVGILNPTGTAVDRTVHVTLAGLDDVHNGGAKHDHEEHAHHHDPEQITAALVGLKSRIASLQLQRQINTNKEEPLQAIMPRMALIELWKMLSNFEKVLMAISILVVIAGLFGMLTSILSTLNERRREMAILRAVGARPIHIFTLYVIEGAIITILGVVVGWFSLALVITLSANVIAGFTGVYLSAALPSTTDAWLLLIIVITGTVMSILPGVLAYRRSLQDGLSIKL